MQRSKEISTDHRKRKRFLQPAPEPRPLMTTLATLFGLLPLALGLGSGAELQKPLALAVIGGLILSTLITLLVMPVLFSLIARQREVAQP